jgi:FixJ family two-component response regulator
MEERDCAPAAGARTCATPADEIVFWPSGDVAEANSRPSPMMPSAPVVFVVDDDASVRKSLELLLDSAGWHAETFASAQEFLRSSPGTGPSCLVLDVSLPEIDGLELQKRTAADRIDMPIIFISGYGDVPTTVRAMKAGAMDFLTKPLANEAFLSVIRRAIERSSIVLAEQAALQSLRERHASLTSREREVMAWVISGLLNKQIGAELDISEITVKAHRGSMMRKMRANSVPHLVDMAAKLGIAPWDPVYRGKSTGRIAEG